MLLIINPVIKGENQFSPNFQYPMVNRNPNYVLKDGSPKHGGVQF